jgi:hypothetical protein
MEQSALTIVARVRQESVEDLRTLLAGMQADPGGNGVLPFARLRGVHFARLVLLDADTDLAGRAVPPQLVFLSDVDGPLDRHLDELVDATGDGIDRVFGFCEGYPVNGAATRQQRLGFLRARMVKSAAVYVNTIGRTLEQIREEARLREAIEEFLDREPRRWREADPGAVRAAVQGYVQGERGLRWALQPERSPTLLERIRLRVQLVATVAGLLLVSPLTLLLLPFWLVGLRLHERADKACPVRTPDARVQQLAAGEDLLVMNQFSAVGFVKPGPFRRLTAIVVLWLVGFGIRQFMHHNNLSGVRTIHFARWVFVDGKRRLFFASNYDGSLESYMGDFIDKVYWGLNAVFSNGVNYPRTSWLVLDGAKDEQAFKYYIRAHQLVSDVWYSAYGQLTCDNIENNAQLRAGLSGGMDTSATRRWLRRL